MDPSALRRQIEPVFRRHKTVIVAYLFGSTARGDAHDRSDLDLAVLLKRTDLAGYRALWADLHDVLLPRPFDLVTLNTADPLLCFEVISDGQPLYYRSGDELNSFETRAWQRYRDTRHLRAIGDHYLAARADEWSSNRQRSASASSDSKK